MTRASSSIVKTKEGNARRKWKPVVAIVVVALLFVVFSVFLFRQLVPSSSSSWININSSAISTTAPEVDHRDQHKVEHQQTSQDDIDDDDDGTSIVEASSSMLPLQPQLLNSRKTKSSSSIVHFSSSYHVGDDDRKIKQEHSTTTGTSPPQQQAPKTIFPGTLSKWWWIIWGVLFPERDDVGIANIVKFQLVDTTYEYGRTVVDNIQNGAEIVLDEYTAWDTDNYIFNDFPTKLTVQAILDGLLDDFTEVEFGYNDTPTVFRDKDDPFSFCGDNCQPFNCEVLKYYPCEQFSVVGRQHTVTATPKNRKGRVGKTKSVTFRIVRYANVSNLLDLVTVSPPTTTTPTINVTSNNATVTFQLSATALYGLKSILLLVNKPGIFEDLYTKAEFKVDNTSMATTAVTTNLTLRFDASIQAGIYPIQVVMIDTQSNQNIWTSDDLRVRSLPHAITVYNADMEGPEIVRFVMVPSSGTVDISSQDQNVTVQLQLVNRVSGSISGTLQVCLLDDCRTFQTSSPPLMRGDLYNWTVDITMEKLARPGMYEFDVILSNGGRNVRAYNTATLALLNWPSGFSTVNPLYDDGPKLINLVVPPLIRRRTVRNKGIRFTFTVQHPIRVLYIRIRTTYREIFTVYDGYLGDVPPKKTWGANTSTVFTVTWKDADRAIGPYGIDTLELVDKNFNSKIYDRTDLQQLGLPTAYRILP